jgi:hypothetical protein
MVVIEITESEHCSKEKCSRQEMLNKELKLRSWLSTFLSPAFVNKVSAHISHPQKETSCTFCVHRRFVHLHGGGGGPLG